MRRRAWWTLYLADSWCVLSLGLLQQMKTARIFIDPPMNEAAFFSLSANDTAGSTPTEPGSFAQLIQLSQVFSRIQSLNRRIAQGETHTAHLDSEVEQIAQLLDDWRAGLPPDLQMTWDNLHLQQEQGMGGSFVIMHLAYHYYATLLWFRFLEDQGNSAPKYLLHIERCKLHASSFSSLLRRARQLKGCEPMFPLVGHMTTVSSSVLLHTLLFGDMQELKAARQELNANFEALMELKQYWPGCSAMVTRLILFQNTCLLSTELKTHQLDGWMLRYLLERSLAEQESVTPVVPPDLCKRPGDFVGSSRAKELAKLGRYTSFEQNGG